MNTVTTTMTLAIAAQAIRARLGVLLASLGRRIDNWVAAFVARRERAAARAVLCTFSDRELKDIGLSRGGIDSALDQPASASATHPRFTSAAVLSGAHASDTR